MRHLVFYIVSSITLLACTNPQLSTDTVQERKESLEVNVSSMGLIDIIAQILLEPQKEKAILSNVSSEFNEFIHTYKKIETNEFRQGVNKFVTMKDSSNPLYRELGEFGLLLVAFDTGNMVMMKEHLDTLNSLDNKSNWLINELNTLNILYYYEMTDYNKTKQLIENLSKSERLSNGYIASVEAWLYLRENKLEKAEAVLKQLKQENEYSIIMSAIVLTQVEGIESAIAYLKNKHKQYPESISIALHYNNFLFMTDPKQANDNLRVLNSSHSNNVWLRLQLAIILHDFLTDDNVDIYNEQLQATVNNETATNYIEYYVNSMQDAMNLDSMQFFGKQVTEFNPMNYQYLYLNYIYSDNLKDKLDFLQKIEHYDPYDNGTLIELANYYQTYNMNKELLEIKQRFDNSPRYKTQEEINIMNQY